LKNKADGTFWINLRNFVFTAAKDAAIKGEAVKDTTVKNRQ
jgi:hypothetical protein